MTVACMSQVQLLIYFMLKYAMEILLSESSVVTSYYFGWNTSTIAVFLAILGLTVLPVNAIVGTYISNMFEDRQILVASEVVLLAGVLLSFRVAGTAYTAAQYVCSALLTFVSAEVLEGVNLSLLSQVMSSRLSRDVQRRPAVDGGRHAGAGGGGRHHHAGRRAPRPGGAPQRHAAAVPAHLPRLHRRHRLHLQLALLLVLASRSAWLA